MDPANYKGKSAVFVTKMKTADTLILNYHMIVLKILSLILSLIVPKRITNILVTKRSGVIP